jgi:hypothetical protein
MLIGIARVTGAPVALSTSERADHILEAGVDAHNTSSAVHWHLPFRASQRSQRHRW